MLANLIPPTYPTDLNPSNNGTEHQRNIPKRRRKNKIKKCTRPILIKRDESVLKCRPTKYQMTDSKTRREMEKGRFEEGCSTHSTHREEETKSVCGSEGENWEGRVGEEGRVARNENFWLLCEGFSVFSYPRVLNKLPKRSKRLFLFSKIKRTPSHPLPYSGKERVYI